MCAARGEQKPPQLTDVRRIYIRSLGNEKGASLIRKELIFEIEKAKLAEVVSSPAKADAILDGRAELWIRGFYSLNPRSGLSPHNGTPVYGGSLSVEIVGKDHDTLWSDLVTPRGASTDLAKQLCKELVRQLAQAIRDGKT